jgi:SAM-dependent methyltransferase
LIPAFNKTVEAKPHTAVYRMHKYFARRPWNVFNELISHYSSPGEIVLDPFCGGGVTVVETLKSKRKAVGVDLNPVATYVTAMQSRPLDLEPFEAAFYQLSKKVGREISSFYLTRCADCDLDAVADWLEWDEGPEQIIRLRYNCSNCGSTKEKAATQNDLKLARELEEHFSDTVRTRDLWFPRTRISRGDKTDYLLTHDLKFFHELFTRRNLLALAILHKEIARLQNHDARDFLNFVLSSSLKWASRQSHLRGNIVEGWAMHAYWIYPKSLEINVWNTFERRYAAICRGKRYSNEHVGTYCRLAEDFDELRNGKASCLILNRSATRLPIPNDSIDAVITDPPYGGNVNYAELSDYWFVWMSKGRTIEKGQEVIINRNQGKTLDDYEKLLCAVFKECYRVLKPHRFLVSTFNSKDLRVVASFIIAASTGGFALLPDGLQYQRPIRSYTTTFHAMQIGAFVGDFIFTFVKERTPQHESIQAEDELLDLEGSLSDLIAETAKGGSTEPQLRERAYRILIPFLGKYARTSISTCREAVDFFEGKMRKHETYFRSTREKITTTRRQKFQRQQRA